jgi:hypothetical protein
MNFVAYEKGTQRITFRYLEVVIPAIVWRYNNEMENATHQL